MKDFKQLYENKDDYDVIIYAGEESKELHAHSLVLRTRSPYFRGVLSYELTKKQNGYFIFKKQDISASTFDVILKFIYYGVVDLRELGSTEVLKVLVAADELGLQKSINYIQKFLIENRDDFLREDPVGMLNIVSGHETFDDLKKFCVEAILVDPDVLFNSNSPELKSNVREFKDQDFKILAKRLRNCIPLIRFHEISMEDFYLRVLPFKKILSKELRDDIIRCYMVTKAIPHCNVYPPRIPTLPSMLINWKHLILFASWIDKKAEYYTSFSQVSYELELLYRSSRDGNYDNSFYQKCADQGATIVVCKIDDPKRLVGGYNPLGWSSSNSSRETKESFIFLFNDHTNIKEGFYLGLNETNQTCYFNSSFAFGSDLACSFTYWSAKPRQYKNIGIPNTFIASNCEVFKVVKKN
ncbi:15870_t:CDS:2 [Acaulospora morrowiae]|uniref:15870_t:CDS:1 n=1 Tax=Acaulospora morrowiae TaxID=94023 RepID=A0A9N9E3W2_9GLOM|nr:15870_t:CDS:2 [Acaulospora morrowiae]